MSRIDPEVTPAEVAESVPGLAACTAAHRSRARIACRARLMGLLRVCAPVTRTQRMPADVFRGARAH